MIIFNGMLHGSSLEISFIGLQTNSETNLHELLLIDYIYLLRSICIILLDFVLDINISAHWYNSEYFFEIKSVGTSTPELCN